MKLTNRKTALKKEESEEMLALLACHCGGYHSTCVRYLEYHEGLSVPSDIMMNVRHIMNTKGNAQYHRVNFGSLFRGLIT